MYTQNRENISFQLQYFLIDKIYIIIATDWLILMCNFFMKSVLIIFNGINTKQYYEIIKCTSKLHIEWIINDNKIICIVMNEP